MTETSFGGVPAVNSGKAYKIATVCPGTSISGTTLTPKNLVFDINYQQVKIKIKIKIGNKNKLKINKNNKPLADAYSINSLISFCV